LLGVPPLAIVTILAGASKQPQWLFLTCVFTGRLIQFLAIAFLLHQVDFFG
jgi:membrane protein YqaA with SNARE-associated domain